jgi:TrmH family RNA methyltransferase
VLRASVGQWFRVSLQACDQPRAIAQQLKQQGIQIIATLPDAPLVYWETDLTVPTLLLMGNEGAGLSAELAQLADLQMRIPLKAGVESLNVAIAAALVLYEAQRQRTIASV